MNGPEFNQVSFVMHSNLGSLLKPLQKFAYNNFNEEIDHIAVEEPLEIRVLYQNEDGEKINRTISVTMRTPGHDSDLALGFLYTEGIIQGLSDVLDVSHCGPVLNQAMAQNIVRVNLEKNVRVKLSSLERNSFTNSSCGVCGKTSLEALRTKLPENLAMLSKEGPYCSPEVVMQLPDLLRSAQSLFEKTGGLHASALFTTSGTLIEVREDVGRHNALDKLIGYALQKQMVPFLDGVLLVSGRVSFELVQKASMAGIAIIVAVGAPSSLALELAEERGISLVGFVRNQRFNVYSGSQRIR